MLVLSRQINQEIVIGEDIRLKVISITGNQVRLGIAAPHDVSVLRSEIHDEVSRHNEAAAQASPSALKSLLPGR